MADSEGDGRGAGLKAAIRVAVGVGIGVFVAMSVGVVFGMKVAVLVLVEIATGGFRKTQAGRIPDMNTSPKSSIQTATRIILFEGCKYRMKILTTRSAANAVKIMITKNNEII